MVNVTVVRSIGQYRKNAKIKNLSDRQARQLAALGIVKIDEEEQPRRKRAYKRRDMTAE